MRFRLRTAGDAELELWAANRHAEPLAQLLDMEITFEGTPDGRSRIKKPRAAADATPAPAPKKGKKGPRLVARNLRVGNAPVTLTA